MQRQVGPYELVRRLGAGGMGEVFLATHRQSGQRVALKLLELDDEEETLRFAREGQSLATAGRHPHVVEVLQLGRDEGLAYMALELVEGGDLAGRLQRGPLDPASALGICRQVCLGVAHMHERGVLHRDLKPANVLLTATGDAKVTDFGLARLDGAETLTQSGEILGTPVYMAPEQARGEVHAYGPWTDVYGLGGVLYASLTGQPPVSSRGGVLATLTAVLEEPPIPPSQLAPGVPPWLDRVCLRALAKSPDERYPSARELLEALSPQADRARPPTRAVLALLGLAAAAGLGYGFAAQPPAEPEPTLSPSRTATSPTATPDGSSWARQARELEQEQARPAEVCEAWQAAVDAARGPARAAYLLELLRYSHRRHQLAPLRRATRSLREAKVHSAEASFALADSLISTSQFQEARPLLEELERAGDSLWSTLAASRLALERHTPEGRARKLIGRVERLQDQPQPPRARALLARARLGLIALSRPFESLDSKATAELMKLPAEDDVQDLLLRAKVFCARTPHTDASSRHIQALLRRLSHLCAPNIPLDVAECLALEATRRSKDPALVEAAVLAACRKLSPYRKAWLLFFAGSRLGQPRHGRQGILRSFALWTQIPREHAHTVLAGWRGAKALRLIPAKAKFANEANQLRFERAVGLPLLKDALPPDVQTLRDAWASYLSEAKRPLGARVIELAIRGAPWSRLEPQLEELAASGPDSLEDLYLRLEIALGRGREAYAQRLAKRIQGLPAEHPRLPVILRILSASEVTIVRQQQGTPHTVHSRLLELEAALRANDPEGAQRWLAELKQLQLPHWALRLRDHLEWRLLWDERCQGPDWPATRALYGALFTDIGLRRATDASGLYRAARALRTSGSPFQHVAACVMTHDFEPLVRAAFAPSRELWLAEAHLLAEENLARPAKRECELRIELFETLDQGSSALSVRTSWERILDGRPLPALLARSFKRLFGEDY